METEKIRIGISSCLLGEKVRWNGGHSQDSYICQVLGKYFEWIPTCPEMGIGMGTPRETVRLVAHGKTPQMVGTGSGRNWTRQMAGYAQKRMQELSRLGLRGYIFKKNSPSCGTERVAVFSETGTAAYKAPGLFARAFMEQFPLLPVEEEGRLNDLRIRENFITRVFALERIEQFLARKPGRKEIITFHTNEKYLLLAHSPKHYAVLGRLVAEQKKLSPAQLYLQYTTLFMEALRLKTTLPKNANVLYHMLGFLKGRLVSPEKTDILETLDDFQNGIFPLIVPLTLIRHYVRKYDVAWLKDQTYLNPHPKELMLRNHV